MKFSGTTLCCGGFRRQLLRESQTGTQRRCTRRRERCHQEACPGLLDWMQILAVELKQIECATHGAGAGVLEVEPSC